jgi:hypothetical protein
MGMVMVAHVLTGPTGGRAAGGAAGDHQAVVVEGDRGAADRRQWPTVAVRV